MKLDQLTKQLDSVLNVGRYTPESNGVIVQGSPEVRKVGGCIDLSWSVLHAASNQEVDFIFSHHAVWKSTDADLVDKKLSFAKNAGISIYVAHESLDVHPTFGTAVTLAKALLFQVESRFADGLGVIADLSGYRDFDTLMHHVRATINPDSIVFRSHDTLGKVGIIAGWGAWPEWMNLAREAGAQTFLSGEAIHFGKLYAKETGLNLILAGHYATESFAIASAIEWIGTEFTCNAIVIDDLESRNLF